MAQQIVILLFVLEIILALFTNVASDYLKEWIDQKVESHSAPRKAIFFIGLFLILQVPFGLIALSISNRNTFDFVVRVRSDSGINIPNAKVFMELPGSPIIDEFTDTNGLAIFSIPQSYSEQSVRIEIEVNGYITHRQVVKLMPNQSIHIIQLESEN